MKNKENNTEKTALYIVRMCKTNGKDLNYALNIISWYSMTEEQDKKIESHINKIWDITKGVTINHFSPINK
jgi:hypothetical protein